MAELADALVLGTSGEIHSSSTLDDRTTLRIRHYRLFYPPAHACLLKRTHTSKPLQVANMNATALWPVLRQTISAWNEDEAPRLGAALAFYTILSLAPLVILAMGIFGLILGSEKAQIQLLNQVESTIGREGSETFKAMIESQRPATGLFPSIIGTITLLFGAARVFGELRDALNKMWAVKVKSSGGIWGMLKQRFFSFGMVFAVGFLLLVSLIISAGLATVGKYFSELLPMPELVLSALNFAVSLAATSVLFALIFKYVPETEIQWRDVWFGSFVTALLFTIGKSLIGLYLGKASIGSAYGAAGSLVVVIVWVYYSSMIFLFGAEFTHAFAAGSHSVAHQQD